MMCCAYLFPYLRYQPLVAEEKLPFLPLGGDAGQSLKVRANLSMWTESNQCCGAFFGRLRTLLASQRFVKSIKNLKS